MKKTVSIMLGIMLLITLLVTAGCAKQITVEFTVEGVDAYTARFAGSTQNTRIGIQRQEDPNDPSAPAVYTMNVMADGDYSMLLYDMNNQAYPFTLKIHNGKVEAETPEGVTVHPAIK